MDERGRRTAHGRRRLGGVAVLLAVWAGGSGCLGPKAIRYTRMQYNEVVRDTNDQQLLMNIVRLRYADSPVFIDLPSITSQFELAAGGSDPGPAGSQTNFGIGGAWGRDTPTLSYHPREGREIAKAMLTPLSADLFSVVNAGANIEQLLLLTVNDMNDVPNAPAPRPSRRGSRTATRISSGASGSSPRSAIARPPSWRSGPTSNPMSTSDPIPADSVGGRDVIDAAKEGYVFRSQGRGQMALLKRDKDLFLKIRPPYVHSPEMEEVARIFRLTPGLSQYRIKSELSDEVTARSPSPAGERHDLPEHEVRPPDHDLPLEGGLRTRGAHPIGDGSDHARPGRTALRLDAGHRGALLRRFAEAPAARHRGRRPLPRLLVLHRLAGRELAGHPGDPRDPLRTPGVRRQGRRPDADPAGRRVRGRRAGRRRTAGPAGCLPIRPRAGAVTGPTSASPPCHTTFPPFFNLQSLNLSCIPEHAGTIAVAQPPRTVRSHGQAFDRG